LTLQSLEPEIFPVPVVDMARSLSPQLANLVLNAGVLSKLDTGTAVGTDEEPEKKTVPTILSGAATNSGLAMGQAFKFKVRNLFNEIEHTNHDDQSKELAFFDNILKETRKTTLELEDRAIRIFSEADAAIFNSHLMFLEDNALLDLIRGEIINHRHSLEFSILIAYRKFEKKFLQMDNAFFRERLVDFKDVMLRLLENAKFSRRRQAENDEDATVHLGEGKWILAADELLPSDLLRITLDNIAGIVCEKGGGTSHVAVLAKALNIPAMLGVRNLMRSINDSDELLLDCHSEKLYINPDDSIIKKFSDLVYDEEEEDTSGQSGDASTADGHQIMLRGNISLICETSLLEKYGADGIGLYRSEFLYMIREYLPSEESQYNVFSSIIKSAQDQSVTFRVLDVGGDKHLPYLELPNEENPALGLRGLRLLLTRPDLFRPHLRAILRAGVYGKLKIMFPMVANLEDLAGAIEILKLVEKELHRDDIPHTDDYEIGIMLEVPSAVFGLNTLIEHVDFMSIGSNDLQQYMFACDRAGYINERNYNSFNPVFLKVLAGIGECFAGYPDKSLSLCGEMAGNPLAAPLLVGARIREMSMQPRSIPMIRSVLKNFTDKECTELLDRSISMPTAADVVNMLEKVFNEKKINISPQSSVKNSPETKLETT
jgi:phosphoenolpyruvate-protein phosphotransferase